MKYFSNVQFFVQNVLFVLHFGSCQNCISSANLVAEIQQKLCNKRALSNGEPCTCEYVTLLQSFHRGKFQRASKKGGHGKARLKALSYVPMYI